VGEGGLMAKLIRYSEINRLHDIEEIYIDDYYIRGQAICGNIEEFNEIKKAFYNKEFIFKAFIIQDYVLYGDIYINCISDDSELYFEFYKDDKLKVI